MRVLRRVGRHPAAAALELRRDLRQRLVAGDVEAAQKLLEQHCPRLLDVPGVHAAAGAPAEPAAAAEEAAAGGECPIDSGGGEGEEEGLGMAVGLQVSCQQFIELIRRGNLDEAVTFGQQVYPNIGSDYEGL